MTFHTDRESKRANVNLAYYKTRSPKRTCASCARSEAPLKLGGGSAVPGTVSSADSEPDRYQHADLVGTIDALVVQ